MNSAISVKEVTSTITASPAGTPSRAKRPIWAGSGRSMRFQSASGAYIADERTSHSAMPSSR